jgi:hypothetical protein
MIRSVRGIGYSTRVYSVNELGEIYYDYEGHRYFVDVVAGGVE